MQVLYDENGYITSYALVGTLVGGTEVSAPEDEEHFTDHFAAYRIRDGDLAYDTAKEKQLLRKEQTDAIRRQREVECFPVINRGQLWYERLTEEQKEELKTWYQAWLDAASTGVVPDRPAWL